MTLKLNGTTSGSVSLDAPATGSNVSFTLPGSVGTSGQLLSTNGSGVLSFVNGGKILQVVRATDTTDRTTTSTSLVDVTGMSVTITPQRSTSALLIIMSAGIQSVGTNGWVLFGLTDSSNNKLSGAQDAYFQDDAGSNIASQQTLIAYVTPATTSAVTYKARFRSKSASQTATFTNSLITGQMYAIEVAA